MLLTTKVTFTKVECKLVVYHWRHSLKKNSEFCLVNIYRKLKNCVLPFFIIERHSVSNNKTNESELLKTVFRVANLGSDFHQL